ncbi:MAG: ACP S-malonyltransferase [Chloroflexota bacterium]
MSERYAFVFPGQGSQSVGMGAALRQDSEAARQILARADEILGFDLSRLCLEGPVEVLKETRNAQPAILAVSIAALAALRELFGGELRPYCVAGHSLGEFSALVAAESLTFEDALSLVRLRGELMSQAGSQRPGAMAAVLASDEVAEAACVEAAEFGTVVVANYNAVGQVVISGEPAAVQKAGELAKAKGARKVIPLSVSGAFHSPLMAVAAHGFASAVAETRLADPTTPVIGNVGAARLANAAAVADELIAQIVSPVRWAQTMDYLVQNGVTQVIEIGPGQVLSGLAKRVANLRVASVDSIVSARSLVDSWRATG